ncbi:MAG TPA: alcohol dehydrogenase catalytic domain-containing protein [Nocardioides sp.]|nr:alcohol dehydrogenase catalytic domain-containing protein [Nocardioides sp.]
MRAVRLTGAGIVLADAPRPEAGDGQALVEVTAAGLCHSDLTLAARPLAELSFPLPFTLGHELAGRVVALGAGVHGLEVGDAVVGYGPRGCGACRACVSGAINLCRRPRPTHPPGLGVDGALASHVAVDTTALVPAAGIEPQHAAVLTDAGLTTWHAARRALPDRRGTVVVLGIGGLGHLAVQILGLWRDVRVIAVDTSAEKRALASALGAVAAAPADVVEAVADLTGGEGADAVLDLVASPSTFAVLPALVAVGGTISIVGVGTARLPVGMHALPLGTRVDLPFWGTRTDLLDVLDLARRGLLTPDVECIALEDAVEGYARLERGDVRGRLVAVPGGVGR